jgi:hypothetical protein
MNKPALFPESMRGTTGGTSASICVEEKQKSQFSMKLWPSICYWENSDARTKIICTLKKLLTFRETATFFCQEKEKQQPAFNGILPRGSFDFLTIFSVNFQF